MYFIMRYRVPAVILFAAVLGFLLHRILKLGELKWLYLIGTPVLTLVAALFINYITDTEWNKKLKEKAMLVSIILFALLLLSFILHQRIYSNGTLVFKDVHEVNRTYVKGYEYTEEAVSYKKEFPYLKTDTALLYDGFGGTQGISLVWTPASIKKTKNYLVLSYSSTVVLGAIFISWILGVAYEKKYTAAGTIIKSLLAEEGMSNFEKYLLSYTGKKNDEKYKNIKLHIFLSYSSAQRQLAEKIFYALSNTGHMVFFDRNNLPVGKEYNASIQTAIRNSDIFIFLISPDAVTGGHYTLSELKFASEQWPSASGFLLPVMILKTPFEQIPAFAKSVTILSPQGNVESEIVAEVEKMYTNRKL